MAALPQKLHCREMESDRSGILTIDSDGVKLYFVGYDEHVHIRDDRPVFVVTEEGEVVSLLENIPGQHGGKYILTKRTVSKSKTSHEEWRSIEWSGIRSNRTVVGIDAWRPDDLVHFLTFKVPDTNNIFWHCDREKDLEKRRQKRSSNSTLFSLDGRGIRFGAALIENQDFTPNEAAKTNPLFSIEYSDGCRINNISDDVFCYLSFLSFVLGGAMIPTDTRIDKLTLGEQRQAVKKGTYQNNYKLLWTWKKEYYRPEDLAYHGAPFLCVDDSELHEFTEGLKVWINRFSEWNKAYGWMTESFRHHNRLGERLLTAYRWFESIPSAKIDDVIKSRLSHNTINGVVSELFASMKTNGREIQFSLNDLKKKVEGSLNKLYLETTNQQMYRLKTSLVDCCKDAHLLDEIAKFSEKAIYFRNKIAHGSSVARGEDQRNLYKSIVALEAFCYLLTVRDLPLSDKGKDRILSHPKIAAFELA